MVVGAAAGFSHSVVMTRDQEVYTFGWGNEGQLGHGEAAVVPSGRSGYRRWAEITSSDTSTAGCGFVVSVSWFQEVLLGLVLVPDTSRRIPTFLCTHVPNRNLCESAAKLIATACKVRLELGESLAGVPAVGVARPVRRELQAAKQLCVRAATECSDIITRY